jgi:hypothetical protein
MHGKLEVGNKVDATAGDFAGQRGVIQEVIPPVRVSGVFQGTTYVPKFS